MIKSITNILLSVIVSTICFQSFADSGSSLLNIYSWSNYTHPEIIKEFERQYGIKVNYDVYDSNYLLESKISLSSSGYDIVMPSNAPFLMRQIGFGLYEKLDKSKLPNYKNLDPKIIDIIGRQNKVLEYSIPYLWGTTGIGYDAAEIKKRFGVDDIDSLSYIFNPQKLEKLASCGVEIIDSPAEVISMLLIYFGKNPKDESKENLQFAEQKLKEIRPYIKSINGSLYVDDLANGEACIVIGFSGDIIQAKNRAAEVSSAVNIKYVRPVEVFEMGVDSLAILKNAKNIDNAYKFINFILDPKIAAKISNYTGYANANKESLKYVEKQLKDNPAIYFDLSKNSNIYILDLFSPQYNKAMMKVWLRFISER